ncbi:SdiA-regulated domain-containing protein [Myxococcota bacterium]|nr:SdiA-regulated domain-containing protein [Myxococcota bacterium]
MSLDRLNGAIGALPANRPWTVDDLRTLQEATGKRLKASERDRLGELLDTSWQRFSEPARRALEALAGRAAPDVEPTKLRVAGRFETGIEEQSALTFVDEDVGLVAIDDESAVLWRVPLPGGEGRAKALEVAPLRDDDGALSKLEGLTFDAKARSFLVVDEDSGRVFELPLRARRGEYSVGAPEELGKLERLGNSENKGWEGLAILPAEHAPDRRARLVAVHEGDPAAVGIFDRKSLKLEGVVELPAAMDPMPTDLSDLAFDAKTGRFFLLSDESRVVWEVELRRTTQLLGAGPPASTWSLVPIHATKLGGRDEKPEGIAIDQRGDVWISFERDGALLKLERGE